MSRKISFLAMFMVFTKPNCYGCITGNNNIVNTTGMQAVYTAGELQPRCQSAWKWSHDLALGSGILEGKPCPLGDIMQKNPVR